MVVQNYTTVGYHGTSQDAAYAILESNFQLSRGEDHWLGIGAYFFEDGIGSGGADAKEWARTSAWDNKRGCNKYDTWGVLKAVLQIPRLWDLTTSDGLRSFEYARAQVRARVKPKESEPQSGRRFDNSVIEFMADKLKFDGLRAWFFIKLTASARYYRVDSGIPNTTVICVRNPTACISLDQVSVEYEGLVNRR